MRKLELWKSEKTYMFPNGAIGTPERINKDFPAAMVFTHVIETDECGQVCYAVENLAALKGTYGIEQSIPDEEAIAQIETIINAPQEVYVSAEERIAAAMEFQNMVALANVNTEGGQV